MIGYRIVDVCTICIAILCSLTSNVKAQTRDTIVTRDLAPGVSYRQFVDSRGQFTAYLVRVDLKRRDLDVRVARARQQLHGRQRTTEMVKAPQPDGAVVLAAVNADFFDLATGENENNQVLNGEWWKGLKVTDSPYDTFDNVHVQFGFDQARRPVMDRFILDAHAIAHGVAMPILTVNHEPLGKYEGSALYTSRFGPTTPHDSARQTVEAALRAAGRRGDTLLFVHHGAIATKSGLEIPNDGAVLSAYGQGLRADEIRAMADGDTVKVVLSTLPRTSNPLRVLVGGWPRLLRDGVNVVAAAPTVEGTISRNAEMKHPRTAIGFSRDSSMLYVLAIDGRSENNGGVTLQDLANIMRRLGAWNAMNFDGGGSTTMVIDGALANRPTDSTGEREVGNALLIIRKK